MTFIYDRQVDVTFSLQENLLRFSFTFVTNEESVSIQKRRHIHIHICDKLQHVRQCSILLFIFCATATATQANKLSVYLLFALFYKTGIKSVHLLSLNCFWFRRIKKIDTNSEYMIGKKLGDFWNFQLH